MAESVVVADNVELVANNIQNKVGATLIGLKSASEKTSNEISEPSIGILDGIRTFQQMTVEKVQGVWDILKAQLDYDKDVDRKIRENEDKKRRAIRGGVPTGIETITAEKKGEEGGLLSNIGALVPATLLTGAGLRLFAGKLFKGGLWALLGAIGGNALVKKLELEGTSAQDAIMTTLPAVAGLMAMFNVKKALLLTLPIVAAMGMKSMTDWLGGDKLASEVSGFDWASVAITGPAAIGLATAFGAKFTLAGGLTLGTVMTIGMPVLIAASLAIALAAGAGYLNSKVSKIEETMLDHLEETSRITQDEFEKNLIQHRSDTLANYFPGLAKYFGADLTMGQEMLLASEHAKKKSRMEGKEGEFSPTETASIVRAIDQWTSMSEDTLKANLDDKHKADELMKVIENMYIVVGSGKLGHAKSKEMFNKLREFSQTIQMTAKDMYTDLENKGEISMFFDENKYLKSIAEDTGEQGDYLERFTKFQGDVLRPKQKEIDDITSSDEYRKLVEKEGFKKYKTAALTEDEKKKYDAFQKKIVAIQNEMFWLEMDWMQSYGRGSDMHKGVDIAKFRKMFTDAEWTAMVESNMLQMPIKKYNLMKDKEDFHPSGNFTNIGASGNSASTTNIMSKKADVGNGSLDAYRVNHALKHKIFITD